MNPQGAVSDFELRQRSDEKPVFLSSLSTNLHELRSRLAKEFEKILWVAEVDDRTLIEFDELLRVDACIDCVRQSKMLVCLLGGGSDTQNHWGTTIRVEEVETVASYFEIEVIHAVLNRVPVIVLVRDDYRPAARLARFIEVLKEVGAAVLWMEGLSDQEIEDTLRRVMHEQEHWRAEGEKRRQEFAHSLAKEIGRSRPRSSQVREMLPQTRWFMGKRIEVSDGRLGDPARARALLEIARRTTGHDRRLTRLYLAASELMLISAPEAAEGEALILWLEVLEDWCTSAAWFGVHNHLSMGVISTLATQAILRERVAKQIPEQARQGLIEGAFASAYYSLGKQCAAKEDKRRVFKAGAVFAGVVARSGKDRGAYIVRASIRAEMRSIRLVPDLVRLAWFSAFSKNAGLRAESLAVLGKAFSKIGLPTLGIVFLRRAVKVHRAEYDAHRVGPEFVVKTYKHLIEALQKRGHAIKANEALEIALSLAKKSGIDDQVRQLEALRK